MGQEVDKGLGDLLARSMIRYTEYVAFNKLKATFFVVIGWLSSSSMEGSLVRRTVAVGCSAPGPAIPPRKH